MKYNKDRREKAFLENYHVAFSIIWFDASKLTDAKRIILCLMALKERHMQLKREYLPDNAKRLLAAVDSTPIRKSPRG